MTGYVFQRLALMLVTLFAIITLTFFLMHAVPGGPFVSDKMMAPEIQAALEAKYHLDQPIWVQYLTYLKGIATLDLGPSFKYPGMSVNQIIAEGLPVTAQVGVLAFICVIALGVPFGVVAALNRNKWPDTLVMVIATVGVAVPSYVLLHHSRWGRYLFAVGSNPEAARLSGVNVPRTIYMAYILSGLCAAFVGVLLASRIGIGNPTQAEGWELQAIASSVIGGTSLFGAIGSVHGPLLGAFILATINNGANLLNVNSFWQRVITGLLIIVIVYFDGLRRRGTK